MRRLENTLVAPSSRNMVLNGLWHPIAFMSQSFIEAEQNYDIY